jgi:hypothetical protein
MQKPTQSLKFLASELSLHVSIILYIVPPKISVAALITSKYTPTLNNKIIKIRLRRIRSEKLYKSCHLNSFARRPSVIGLLIFKWNYKTYSNHFSHLDKTSAPSVNAKFNYRKKDQLKRFKIGSI